VTAGTVKRCKDALGIDLGDPLTPAQSFERWVIGQGFKPSKLNDEQRENLLRLWVQSAGPWLTRYDTDIIFKVDLLFVVCEPTAKEREITPEQFAERLGGDALHTASDALIEALLDFFRSLRRTEIVKAIETQAAIVRRQIEEFEKTLESPAMTKYVEGEFANAKKKVAATLGASAVSTP